MTAGGYLFGLAVLVASFGPVVFGAVRVCRARLPDLEGATRLAAVTLVTTCGLAAAVLVPGMFGVLSRGTFLVCSLAMGGSAWFVPAVAAHPRENRVNRGENRADIVLALTAVIAVSTWVFAELVHTGGHPVTGGDALAFDLPIIGQWIQTGSVWHITELIPYQAHGTYPQSGHLLLAAFVLPFHNDAFVRLPGYLYAGVTGATTYGIARELRAPRSTAAVFAAMFVSLPMNGLDLENWLPDTVGSAAFAAGLLFLIRQTRTKRRSDLVLAGLGLASQPGRSGISRPQS